jgi:hypothetical protein
MFLEAEPCRGQVHGSVRFIRVAYFSSRVDTTLVAALSSIRNQICLPHCPSSFFQWGDDLKN